jgi:glutaredoxin 2
VHKKCADKLELHEAIISLDSISYLDMSVESEKSPEVKSFEDEVHNTNNILNLKRFSQIELQVVKPEVIVKIKGIENLKK